MVKLHKSDIPAKSYLLYISDDCDYIDYITATLDNRDILRVVGEAYKKGYTDFVVGISVIEMNQAKDVNVLKVHDGDISVNWDIVRKLDKAEWNA